MAQDIRPIVPRRARSILSSSLIASAAVALTVALVAFPASNEASAQGFKLPGLSKKGGSNVVFLKKGKSNKAPSSSQGGSSRNKGLAANSGTGGSGGKGTGGSGRGSGASGSGSGKGGQSSGGRTPGGKTPTPPPVIIGVGGAGGVIVGATTPGDAQNSGGGSNPGNQVTRRPGTGVPPANERNYVPDEVVIELAADTTDQAADALAQRFQLQRLESFDFQLAGTKLYLWRIPDPDRRSVPTVIRALEASGIAISVGPNNIMKLYGEHTVAVSAPALEQYALAKLQVPQAHQLARGDKVLIAIIDGGVDASHPELAGVIADTFDAIGSGDKLHAHGTAIAGAIAAQARLKGTAPAAQILAARAFGARSDESEGTSFHVAAAINWAVARGARIINMSFAGPNARHMALSIAGARAKGVVLVAAAGNAGPRSQPLYPAADPNVIAVTATDEEDRLFSAANRGKHIAVAAPGVELWLPGLNGTYQEKSGTSFAAAEVSGTIALMIERKPNLTHDEVRRTLMSTARDLGPRGIDSQFGAGLVDAYRAVLSIDASAASTGQARSQ